MAEAAVQSTGAGQKAGQEAIQDQKMAFERPFGWGGVFIFALSGIGLTYSGLIPFSTIAGLWPGANLIGALSIAVLVAMTLAYGYSAIGAAVRRNGADYILASRVLSRPLAFASSWVMVIVLALAGGMIIGAIFQDTLPMFARILSVVFGDHLLTTYLETISSQSGVVLFGSFGILIMFSVLLLSPQATRHFLLVGFGLTLVAWLVIALQLANASGPAFQQSWEQTVGSGSFAEHLLEARGLGMSVDTGFGSTVLAGFASGLTLFFGYFLATNFAQEVKEPQKNLLRGSWTALLTAWAALSLTAFLMQRLVPLEWLAAQSYLARLPEFQEIAMPWLPYYAMLVNPNPLLFWVLAAAWTLPLVALALTLLYASSRVIQAWAEEGMLPPEINFVHPVLRSPLIAVLLVSIVAEVGLVYLALDGNTLARINPVFFIACVQLLPVLALTLLPFRKREWFEEMPPQVRGVIGRLPLVSVIGALSLAFLLWTIISMLLSPALYGINLGTLILFVLLFGMGLGWYFGLRVFRASQKKTLVDSSIERLKN